IATIVDGPLFLALGAALEDRLDRAQAQPNHLASDPAEPARHDALFRACAHQLARFPSERPLPEELADRRILLAVGDKLLTCGALWRRGAKEDFEFSLAASPAALARHVRGAPVLKLDASLPAQLTALTAFGRGLRPLVNVDQL